jgi:hypothetical protein
MNYVFSRLGVRSFSLRRRPLRSAADQRQLGSGADLLMNAENLATFHGLFFPLA